MKAMLLAAGRGERMRPLTDTTPKPLLDAGGQSLIVHAINRLHEAGINELVINLSWLSEQIEATLGDGQSLHVNIRYSREPVPALETAGGIRKALPLLGDEPFVVCNADVWTDFDFSRLPSQPEGLAHLVLVKNPDHNPNGDFVLQAGRVKDNESADRLTFSGIGVYRHELFDDGLPQRAALAPILRAAMQRDQVSGEQFTGQWHDVGTIGRLQKLRDLLGSA